MLGGNEKDVSGQMQKLNIDDDGKAPASGSTTVVMRLILQSADVGKIIGPKGATVEGFKQKTGATISFSTYQPSMPRVAKIAGPIQGVVQAIMLISKTVAINDSHDPESTDGDEKAISTVLMVPFPHVGRIIGKRGQRIKTLREESGTTITIVANNVTITGRYGQVENAVLKLTELLQEVSKRNPVSYAFPFENHNSGGSQSMLANQAALQYHMVQLAPDTMQVLIPSSSAGVVIGRGGSTIQRLKSESGASISLSNYVKGAENRVATISGTPRAMAKAILALAVQIATDGGNLPENAMSLSIVLLVPPQELGAIIGKKGTRITDLRNSTTASINVADEGSVTIQGTTAAVSEAIKKIAFLLYDTRNKLSSNQAVTTQVSNGVSTNTSHGPAAAAATASTSAKAAPQAKDVNKIPKVTNSKIPPAPHSTPPSAAALFKPVDSQIFLPSLLQTSLGSKFQSATTGSVAPGNGRGNGSSSGSGTGNVKKSSTDSKSLRAKQLNGDGVKSTTSNATYAQKTAGIKPTPVPSASDKVLAPIGLSGNGTAQAGVYPQSNFASATSQSSQMSQPMYHAFSSEMLHPHHAHHAAAISPQQQQGHQVVLIGNHWATHALSQQQQPHPPRGRGSGDQQSSGTERKQADENQQSGTGTAQSGKNAMQAQQLLSGLPSVLPGPSGHQFSSAFQPLQGTLGQNFYAGTASWYTPPTHQRFQAYDPPQQMSPHQSWQPAGAQRQQQSTSVVVPPSGIPINQQPPQSISAEALPRSNDLWS